MYSSSIQVSLLDSLERCEKKIKIHVYIVPQRKQQFFTMLFFCISTKWYATRLALLLYRQSHVKIWNLYLHQISFEHACDWQSWSARITYDFTHKGKLWYLLKLFVRTQASRSWTIVKFNFLLSLPYKGIYVFCFIDTKIQCTSNNLWCISQK